MKRKKKIPHGKKSPQTRLNALWFQKKKEIGIKDLINIVRIMDYPPLKKRAVIEFLTRDNLSFDNFYRMLGTAEDVLEKYEDLKSKFWKQYLELCSPDNLVELIEIGEKEAAKELFFRIENASISNRKAKQVLIRIFEIVTDEKVRREIWRKIKELEPQEEELIYILNLPCMYAFPRIISQAQKLLRPNRNKKKSNRILKRIEKLIEEIKKGQD